MVIHRKIKMSWLCFKNWNNWEYRWGVQNFPLWIRGGNTVKKILQPWAETTDLTRRGKSNVQVAFSIIPVFTVVNWLLVLPTSRAHVAWAIRRIPKFITIFPSRHQCPNWNVSVSLCATYPSPPQDPQYLNKVVPCKEALEPQPCTVLGCKGKSGAVLQKALVYSLFRKALDFFPLAKKSYKTGLYGQKH